MRSHVLGVVLAASLLAAGCYGFGSTDGDTPPPTSPNGAPVSATPLSRLTATQVDLTLTDLFAPIVVPPASLPADARVENFDDNASAQTPSAALIEGLHTTAVAAAEAAMKSASAFLGCAPKSRSEEDACAAAHVARFGARAYRRPLTPAEQTELIALYGSFRADGSDFATSMTLVVEAILQSPPFVYRIEAGIGPSASPRRIALDGYEIASRLSYLLWNTMPDAELLEAARTGALDRPSGVEAQARRLLQSPRARAAVARFHAQWLRFDRMQGLKKDATIFPGFGDATAASMRASVTAWVDHAFFDDGSMKNFFVDDHAYVDDALAPIYGVPSPGAKLALVGLDKTQRAGILTQAGILAGLAHETDHSPILRGVFVLDGFLCAPPPPPPKNVPPAPAVDATQPKTTRDRFEKQHEQGVCAGCHRTIDGLGFGFEHYDAIGRFRMKDSGFDVNSAGALPDTGDLKGTFDGAVELGQKLAASRSVQSCIAQQWYRYALGVEARNVDSVQLGPIVDQFVAHDLDLRELVIALVTSEAFRSRIEDK